MEVVQKTEVCELVGHRPHKFLLRKHDLSDLLSIPLNPPSRYVRCVYDTYEPQSPNLDEMLHKAFIAYHKQADTKSPQFLNRLDGYRFWLDRTLRKWKVIV